MQSERSGRTAVCGPASARRRAEPGKGCPGGLLRSIPPELGNLVNLERLDLSGNGLTGVIPPELGRLAKLEVLWLVGTRLQGTVCGGDDG